MTGSTLSILLMLLSAGHGSQPPADVSALPRLADLPSRFAHDLVRLGTMPSIAVLGVGGGAALIAHPADTRSLRALSTSTAAETALDGGAAAGSAPAQFGLAAAVYGVGLAVHSAAAADTGSALLEAQLVEGVITQSLKHTVGRTRPNGGRYSFPSGHSSSTFATADILLQRFGWRAGAAAYALAAYVGASRIAERDHYLSDIVFGAAVGIASARTIRAPLGRRSIGVRAIPLAGGAALLVSVRPPS